METIIEKKWNYKLEKNNENYFLEVLCGSVGLYEIKIKLSLSELKSFKEGGEQYIDTLAVQIQNDSSPWLSRAIS